MHWEVLLTGEGSAAFISDSSTLVSFSPLWVAGSLGRERFDLGFGREIGVLGRISSTQVESQG